MHTYRGDRERVREKRQTRREGKKERESEKASDFYKERKKLTKNDQPKV